VVSPDGSRWPMWTAPTSSRARWAARAPTLVAPGTAPAWAPDGSGLVYQNADRQLVLHGAQVTSGEDIFPFPVRFLPDGRFLYTADGQIRVRDAAGGSPATSASAPSCCCAGPCSSAPEGPRLRQHRPAPR
jgi:hypothetical protein